MGVQVVIEGFQLGAIAERLPSHIPEVPLHVEPEVSACPLVVDDLVDQPLRFLGSAKVVEDLHVPMGKQVAIVGLVPTKATHMERRVDSSLREVIRKFQLIVGGTRVGFKDLIRSYIPAGACDV